MPGIIYIVIMDIVFPEGEDVGTSEYPMQLNNIKPILFSLWNSNCVLFAWWVYWWILFFKSRNFILLFYHILQSTLNNSELVVYTASNFFSLDWWSLIEASSHLLESLELSMDRKWLCSVRILETEYFFSGTPTLISCLQRRQNTPRDGLQPLPWTSLLL